MAKPGSNGARRIAREGVVDLSNAKMSDLQARRLEEDIELAAGQRCSGCGRRIRLGFKFTSVDVRARDPIMKLAACSRDDCDFAAKCRPDATLMEQIEHVWLDENGPDAPPALSVVERNARRVQQTAPDG